MNNKEKRMISVVIGLEIGRYIGLIGILLKNRSPKIYYKLKKLLVFSD